MKPPRPLLRQRTFINLLFLFCFSANCFIFAQAPDEQGSRRLIECGLGSGGDLSGSTSPPTGQLQDASSVRIRDASNKSPTFDSEGVVSGRIEVKPSGETAWGTIRYYIWDDVDALVACREIGNELGYATISGTALYYYDTPDGSGKIWWSGVGCLGSEETLESCSKSTTTSTYHPYDIGITCKFVQADECEACPAGTFSDTIDTSPCTNCEAGRYSSTPSATLSDTCLACEAGKAAAAGSSSCTSCIGSYSTTEGSASCTQCAAGRYSSTVSATSSDTCLACEAGKASSTTGATSESMCLSCEAGTYATAASASCTSCEAGRYSSAPSATSSDTCLACEAEKASSTSGSTSESTCKSCAEGKISKPHATTCTPCIGGLTRDDQTACEIVQCNPTQFNNNGYCQDCDNKMSIILLAGSFLSFAVVAWHANIIAADRKKMMRLRVVSTFFQTAELTTLIQVAWPVIVYITLPFQLPISDMKCLASSSGWTQVNTFYAYIYGPILFFMLLYKWSDIKTTLRGASDVAESIEEIERTGTAATLTVLTTLWYSPLLQTVTSMFDCHIDPDRNDEYFLKSDPNLVVNLPSTETSSNCTQALFGY
ncbi:hypothetical protein TrST_g13909 [Triparma strigata]|uniref:SRCR domain-containing protein n=1 Tax=Triparma strigata TaxID=1606541 RepID=A0A9W7ER32_9STRA|nr:hypothetical protein TrST_g13909 [Triparma strigata]